MSRPEPLTPEEIRELGQAERERFEPEDRYAAARDKRIAQALAEHERN